MLPLFVETIVTSLTIVYFDSKSMLLFLLARQQSHHGILRCNEARKKMYPLQRFINLFMQLLHNKSPHLKMIKTLTLIEGQEVFTVCG